MNLVCGKVCHLYNHSTFPYVLYWLPPQASLQRLIVFKLSKGKGPLELFLAAQKEHGCGDPCLTLRSKAQGGSNAMQCGVWQQLLKHVGEQIQSPQPATKAEREHRERIWAEKEPLD